MTTVPFRRTGVPLLTTLAVLVVGACTPAAPPAGPAPVEAPPRAEVAPPPPTEVVEDVPVAVYDLPVVSNLRVSDELNFLVSERPEVLRTWMARGVFYQPFIESVLAEHGLPVDLYFLAMIESGFVPTARSHAGAVGMWQFMPATGRSEGLRIDAYVDERRDPVRSTRAAARHLVRLHRHFNDWSLATAAYNAGAGRVSRGMERFAARDFWDLANRGDLARETRQYVPRLYAVTMAGRNPERFGLPTPRAEATFSFDSVLVSDSVPLSALAELGGLEPAQLERLNPHILKPATPPGEYVVWVPSGSGELAQAAYESARSNGHLRPTRLVGEPLAEPPRRVDPAPQATPPARPVAAAAPESVEPAGGARVHEVGEGENLWGIARRYGVSISALEAANELAGPVRSGDRLVIPAAEQPARTANAGGGGSELHRVEAGETLWRISQQYGVAVEALRVRNGLAEEDPLRVGQELQIPR